MKNSISPWWIRVNLTDYVKTVSIEDFGWEFKHQALWNKRLHELCHYHLYFQGKGYKHADRDFKDLLAKVDGLRYAPKMQGQEENYYLYQCQSCGRIYRRKRRVNTRKFGCGLCRGKLIFLNQS